VVLATEGFHTSAVSTYQMPEIRARKGAEPNGFKSEPGHLKENWRTTGLFLSGSKLSEISARRGLNFLGGMGTLLGQGLLTRTEKSS